MGFIKFTKGTSLSDKDRKALQKLLTLEKKKLQSALKDVDASLSVLGGCVVGEWMNDYLSILASAAARPNVPLGRLLDRKAA